MSLPIVNVSVFRILDSLPVVAVPTGFSPFCAPQRCEIIEMQRACMFIIAGYSSASDMFLEIFSMINLSASFSMYVPTKLYLVNNSQGSSSAHIPGKVEVRSAIQIQLVLEHRVDSLCVHSMLRDPKLGYLFRSCVACGVWRSMADGAIDKIPVMALWMAFKSFDDLVGVDLEMIVSLEYLYSGAQAVRV